MGRRERSERGGRFHLRQLTSRLLLYSICLIRRGLGTLRKRQMSVGRACKPATGVAVQQVALLYGKRICCAATTAAARQFRLPHCNWICCTAIGFAVQQLDLLHRSEERRV